MTDPDRGNSYLLKQMKSRFPAIYADYQAGKYRSVRAAAIAAGLRQPTKELNVLKGAWRRASKKEQRAFLDWIGTRATPVASMPVVDAERRLLPTAKRRIQFIMVRRNLKQGDVMHEMGFKKLNASLGMALNNDTRLDPNLVRSLEKWLDDNKGVT